MPTIGDDKARPFVQRGEHFRSLKRMGDGRVTRSPQQSAKLGTVPRGLGATDCPEKRK